MARSGQAEDWRSLNLPVEGGALDEPALERRFLCRPRTPLFTAALILTAVHALFLWVAGALLVNLAWGTLPGLRAWIEERDFFLGNLLLSLAPWLGLFYLALATLQLLACAGAWYRSRAWTWTLLLLALLSLPTSGPLSVLLALLMIPAAAQVLDQSRPFPRDEEWESRGVSRGS